MNHSFVGKIIASLCLLAIIGNLFAGEPLQYKEYIEAMSSSDRTYILRIIDRAIDYSNDIDSEIHVLLGDSTPYNKLDEIDIDSAEKVRKTHNETAEFHNVIFSHSNQMESHDDSLPSLVLRRQYLQTKIDNLVQRYNDLMIQESIKKYSL